MKYLNNRLLHRQISFWSKHLQTLGKTKALLHMARLRGFTAKLAITAFVGLWGKDALAQPVHFFKKPLTELGAMPGLRDMSDIDNDGQVELVTLNASNVFYSQELFISPDTIYFGPPQLIGSYGGFARGFRFLQLIPGGNEEIAVMETSKIVFLDNVYDANPLAEVVPLPQEQGSVYDETDFNYIAIIDFDNDGDDDVVATNIYWNAVSYGGPYPGGCSGCYTNVQYNFYTAIENQGEIGGVLTLNSTYGANNHEKVIGDFNNDGFVDYVGTSIVMGNNLGTFSHIGTSGLTYSMLTTDVDGDGDLDIFSSEHLFINQPNQIAECNSDSIISGKLHLINQESWYDDDIHLINFVPDYNPDNLTPVRYFPAETLLNAQIDLDGDIYQKLRIVSTSHLELLEEVFIDEVYMGYNDYGPFVSIVPLDLDTEINLYDFKGLLFKTTDTVNISFQFFDGNNWTEPCGMEGSLTPLFFEGFAFYDKNGNTNYDTLSELPIEGLKLTGNSTGFYSFSGNGGKFFYQVNNQDAYLIPSYGPFVSSYSLSPSLLVNQETPIECAVMLEQFLNLELSTFVQPIPQDPFNWNIQVDNLGPIETPCFLYVKLPEGFDFLNTSPEPVSSSGDTLIFDVQTLSFQEKFDLQIQMHGFTNVLFGTIATFSSWIVLPEGNQADVDSTNNQSHVSFLLGNSYDPNDKAVDIAPQLSIAEAENLKWLTYTIRFQNTGTLAAQDIYITDTLDTKFNFDKLEVINSSHLVQTLVKPNGSVKFVFDDIWLPDSTSNEPASHGFVQYRVQLQDTLLAGESVQNTAHIYFDFNPPVVTNTVVNSVEAINNSSTPMVPRNTLAVSPNPNDGRFLVALKEKPVTSFKWVLFDTSGSAIWSKPAIDHEEMLQLDFPAGTYFVGAFDNDGNCLGVNSVILK